MSQLSRPLAENRSDYRMKLSSLLALLFAHNLSPIVQDVKLSYESGDINDDEAVEELKNSKLAELGSTGCQYLSQLLGIDYVVYALPNQEQLANTSLPSGEVSIATADEIDPMAKYDTVMIEDNQ